APPLDALPAAPFEPPATGQKGRTLRSVPEPPARSVGRAHGAADAAGPALAAGAATARVPDACARSPGAADQRSRGDRGGAARPDPGPFRHDAGGVPGGRVRAVRRAGEPEPRGVRVLSPLVPGVSLRGAHEGGGAGRGAGPPGRRSLVA